MLDVNYLMTLMGCVVVVAPAVLVVILGIPALVGRRLSEHTTLRAVRSAVATGLLACLAVLIIMPFTDGRTAVVDLGDWVALRPAEADHSHYHFVVEFEFDVLSVPLALLSFLLCGTIGAFAARYLHRESGLTASSSSTLCFCSE